MNTLNTIQCLNCENKFLSSHFKTNVQPWNCPICNNDSEDKIQKDLNDLFKLIGFEAVDRFVHRANRNLILSQMYKKGDEQPVTVTFT
jgi:hypothetical protein